MSAYEVNFDGLVGPTHNYSGLSFGNIASTSNSKGIANPKLAALQGLDKMKTLSDMGFKQGVLPPQERPCIATLRQLGFDGSDVQVIQKAVKDAPQLFSAVNSASSMWVANAATVTPSADSMDGKVHFTAANLQNKFHRSIEHDTTSRALGAIFANSQYFSHHAALPMHESLGDEGAANHNRLCACHGQSGVEVFVYGHQYYDGEVMPYRYPARQTKEASQAVARLHQLDDQHVVFLQQNPQVIDQGVFHNDVIAVANGPVLFHHQDAFFNQTQAFDEIKQKLALVECEFHPIQVARQQVSVADAINTYLFNSQLLTKPNGRMMIVVPQEARENLAVWHYLESLVAGDSVIDEVRVFDLRESMRNGGGPACLRLRVVLQGDELHAINPSALLDDNKYQILTQWVNSHYRDRLSEHDLHDPHLCVESREALDELTQIMNLGSIYPFQI